jgi:hypothetical protein
MENLKNPIILGLLTSGICYTYLKLTELQSKKENPNELIESSSMKYPILLGIIVFIAFSIWNNYGRIVIVKNIPVKIPVDISISSPIVPAFRSLGDALPHVFLEAV